MSNQIIFPRALDANGYVSPGAKARVTLSGTDTLTTVYSDAAGTIPATNPVTADANGLFPQRYVNGQVRVAYTTAADATLFTQDPAPAVQSTGSGASEISFDPTVDLPFTNAQDAIEGAAAAAVAGFNAFGIGITGNAELLADLDATTIGAGVYRFDGTTVGTFPSGVTAADTGIVETWRQTAALAMMELGHATSDRIWQRRLSGGSWGAWREIITANQAAVEGDLIYRGATAWTRLAKGAAGQPLVMNAGATAPEWGSGFVPSFYAAAQFSTVPISGTYTRTGNTATCTIVSHGMTTGQSAFIAFTSGGATDGFYPVTVTGVDTFTVQDPVSGSTSGNVTRRILMRSGTNIASISRAAIGQPLITFSTAAPTADYRVIGSAEGRVNHPGMVAVKDYTFTPTTTQCRLQIGLTGAVAQAGTIEDSSHVSIEFSL